jgi:phosphatidylglycerol:prolipoprotein diacylglycerol transferase
LALQFPDFDPAIFTIPAVSGETLTGDSHPIMAAALFVVSAAVLYWRQRRTHPTSDSDTISRVSILGSALWTLLGLAGVWLLACAVVWALHLEALGPFPIRWYALAYIAGILIGWRYCLGLVRNVRLWGERAPSATTAQIDDLVLWLTLAVILGGRIGYIGFYMLVDPRQRVQLFAHPIEALQIWNGGMSFHGALIGVSVAVILFARANRIPLLALADLVAPCEPIGQFFGRLANFINGELWGRPTEAPWGVVFCNNRIRGLNDGGCPAGTDPRHPSQLYEAALEGVVLFLVLRWATHRAHWLQRPGAVTGLWLIGYGAIRIGLENVRNPDEGMPNFPLGLTMGMMLSVPMVLAGLFLLWRALREPPAQPQSA